jgi:glutaminyl-tRNA synthetase
VRNAANAPEPASNFLRSIIAEDVRSGKHGGQVVTRFPPEPNGYLHYGHAKSIALNFGLAGEFGGTCHLRFDDTNPLKEDVEYEDAIAGSVRWLGYDWGEHRYHASDYYDTLYALAEWFVEQGLAYVDSQSAEEMRATRGTLTQAGIASPYRGRSVAENLDLLRRMRAGAFADGAHVLRLKIDMAAANVVLRDPAIYRIRHAEHHRTGNRWPVYPLYDYAHCISDALENITHSICTLEFENNRALYDWILEKLVGYGLLRRPRPHQHEFARLNLTYVVLSKRRLIQLVDEGHVEGWDDPRMPTLVGARRRGYTPEGFRLFAERIGVAKADSWIDYAILEECMRSHMNETAPRRIAVLDPVKLIVENYPEHGEEAAEAPNHPQRPDWGKRSVPFTRELWIEREDFTEAPPKGYFRLFPGNRVRLRYGYVVECTGCDKDAAGNVVAVRCRYFPDSKSGTPGADAYKVKGNIHWVSAKHAYSATVRLYDRLFRVPHPGAGGDFIADLNPDSRRSISAQLEPALRQAEPEARYQFERHGYFVADRVDSRPGAPVFNRAVSLKDSWKD